MAAPPKPNRVELPYQTGTAGVLLSDTDNLYRIRDIETALDLIDDDDGLFYRYLTILPNDSPASQARYDWTESDMIDNHTQINNSGGYTASATSIVVDDSLLAVANRLFLVQRTKEILYVTAVTYATHTLTVTRGFNGTAALALNDDDKIIALPAVLPERATANSGTGLIPTGEEYNYISTLSETFQITEIQENSEMAQGVATVPWEVANKALSVRRQINKALMYGKRGQVASASDGPIFQSQGFEHYIKSNILDLELNQGGIAWPDMNDWLYGLSDFSISSKVKQCLCGNWLWSSFVRFKRDEELNGEKPYYDPIMNTNLMSIVTDEGVVLEIMQDKHGFDAREGLGGDGIVLDSKYAALKEMRGMPLAWRQNVQANDAHVRKDEIWGTYSLKLRHEQLHGIIRNATRNVRTGLK
jgi:hypothetical protein